MIKVSFSDCMEIRMGSPFSICSLNLAKRWRTVIGDIVGEYEWQDKVAHSRGGRFVALVYWDSIGNNPSFRILVLDTRAKHTTVSRRIRGCCEEVIWRGHTISYRTFDKRKGVFGVYEGTFTPG